MNAQLLKLSAAVYALSGEIADDTMDEDNNDPTKIDYAADHLFKTKPNKTFWVFDKLLLSFEWEEIKAQNFDIPIAISLHGNLVSES